MADLVHRGVALAVDLEVAARQGLVVDDDAVQHADLGGVLGEPRVAEERPVLHGVDVQRLQPAALQRGLHLPVLSLAVHVEPVRVGRARDAGELEPKPVSAPPVAPPKESFITSI